MVPTPQPMRIRPTRRTGKFGAKKSMVHPAMILKCPMSRVFLRPRNSDTKPLSRVQTVQEISGTLTRKGRY